MGKMPLIVSEKRREVTELQPPKHYHYHDWNLAPDRVEVYVAKTAMENIIKHCNDFVDQNLEVMGFFMGDRFQWKGQEFTIVEEIVTTDLDTTSVSVKFQREGFEKLFEQMDKHQSKYDYLLVGWYHSHPGHTCFMSETDVDTQTSMFKHPYQCAMVVDPVNREMKAFKVEDGVTREIKVMVYDERLWNHDDGDTLTGEVPPSAPPRPQGEALVAMEFIGPEIAPEAIVEAKGVNYLATLASATAGFELAVDLADLAIEPLCVTVKDPEALMSTYEMNERNFLWLNNADQANAIPATEINEIIFELNNFLKANRETVIYMDSLDEILASNPLAEGLRFIHELNQSVIENSARLIVPRTPLMMGLYILANSKHIDITDEEGLAQLDEGFKRLFQQRRVKEIVQLRARKKSKMIHEIEHLFAPITVDK